MADAGISSAAISLLSNAAGTLASVMDSRNKYLAFRVQAQKNLIAKRNQSQEEQRTAGERAELRMAQFQSNVGAASVMAGGGSSMVDAGVYKMSLAYGTALEEVSDNNAVQIRLGQIEDEMKATREAVVQARKQTAVNTWLAVVGGATQGAFDIAKVQGAVTAKREENKIEPKVFKIPNTTLIDTTMPSDYHGYNPDKFSLLGGK